MTSRSRSVWTWPIWTWIIGLIFAAPILYVLSFGPACWWFASGTDPSPGYVDGTSSTIFFDYQYAPKAYWPFGVLVSRSHQNGTAFRIIRWYATLGHPRVLLSRDSQGSDWMPMERK